MCVRVYVRVRVTQWRTQWKREQRRADWSGGLGNQATGVLRTDHLEVIRVGSSLSEETKGECVTEFEMVSVSKVSRNTQRLVQLHVVTQKPFSFILYLFTFRSLNSKISCGTTSRFMLQALNQRDYNRVHMAIRWIQISVRKSCSYEHICFYIVFQTNNNCSWVSCRARTSM